MAGVWHLYPEPVQAQIACIWEASARKIGNVHPQMSFAGTGYTDFLISGALLGRVFSQVRLDIANTGVVGFLVEESVGFTKLWVGSNTNLGIALILAPLAVTDRQKDMRSEVEKVLAQLTRRDAKSVFRAIRLASPGGLGDAPDQDVRDEPTVTLLEAMKLAADRDMIACQYANGFADVFDFGTPAFLEAFAKFGTVEAAIVDCQLRWLAAFPDSLIARKNGLAVAEDVQKRAAAVLELGGIATPEGRAAGVALDRHLRSDGNKLNPGTTADLIAACLFVALREGKIAPSAPFRWPSPDWL